MCVCWSKEHADPCVLGYWRQSRKRERRDVLACERRATTRLIVLHRYRHTVRPSSVGYLRMFFTVTCQTHTCWDMHDGRAPSLHACCVRVMHITGVREITRNESETIYAKNHKNACFDSTSLLCLTQSAGLIQHHRHHHHHHQEQNLLCLSVERTSVRVCGG